MERVPSRSSEFGHMIMLAPRVISHSSDFDALVIEDFQYNALLKQAQRVRGQVYLQDGAVRPWELTRDGRLVHRLDTLSWHLLILNPKGRVAGCIRYSEQPHDLDFSNLAIADAALAQSPQWGGRLRQAVDAKRREAKSHGFAYGEVGGWALVEELRHSRDALRVSLAIYSLMRYLGGALALATATVRHNSAAILRKLGGQSLNFERVELPTYYDPHYECEMEVLSFDSRRPNPKYEAWIQSCQMNLPNITALCAAPQTMHAATGNEVYAGTPIPR